MSTDQVSAETIKSMNQQPSAPPTVGHGSPKRSGYSLARPNVGWGLSKILTSPTCRFPSKQRAHAFLQSYISYLTYIHKNVDNYMPFYILGKGVKKRNHITFIIHHVNSVVSNSSQPSWLIDIT